MNVNFFSRYGLMLLMIVLQALVFNHIHLWGCAIPLPYVYFLLLTPSDQPRWRTVLEGFILGIFADMTTSTIGVSAAAMTLLGLLVPWYQKLFSPNESSSNEVYTPSVSNMHWGRFMQYSFFCTLSGVAAFYLLEQFTLYHITGFLGNVIGSTLLTLIFIAVYERIRTRD